MLLTTRRRWRKRVSVRRRASGRVHYNYFRDYDSAVGRYVQSDPIGLLGSALSTFTYAYDSPLKFVDPSGLAPPGGATDFRDFIRNSFFGGRFLTKTLDQTGNPGAGVVATNFGIRTCRICSSNRVANTTSAMKTNVVASSAIDNSWKAQERKVEAQSCQESITSFSAPAAVRLTIEQEKSSGMLSRREVRHEYPPGPD